MGLLALCLVAAACVGSDNTTSVDDPGGTTPVLPPTEDSPAATTTTTTDVATIEAAPGQLVWVHDREPPSLHADDPANPTDVADWIQQGLLEGLFGIGSDNGYYPELLAEEPELKQLNSGTVVIDYRLREGLSWSDGTPLTSADVAYTHDIITEGCEIENDRSIVDSSDNGCEFDFGSRFGYELVTDFEVVSDTEFQVTMAAFFGGWRGLYDRVLAAHAFGATARDVNDNLQRWGGDGRVLPSSGPLVFDRWEPGTALYLARNDTYHGSNSPDTTTDGPTSIDGVQLVFVADLETRIDLLLAGDAHIIMTGADPALAPLATSDGFTVASAVGPTFEHWSLNLLDRHLAKPEVREAVAHAIDKTELVSELYEPLFGPSLPADGLGNSFWMVNQAPYEDHQASYAGAGLAAAGRALTAAGYQRGDDGVWAHPVDGRLSLRAGTTGGVALRDAQLELLVSQLGDAGIEVVIDSEAGGLFFTEGPFSSPALAASASGGRSGDSDVWDIAQFSWTSGPWPGAVSGIYRSGSASNPYGFNNPEYDVAATDCDALVDDAERSACYNELDRFVTTLDQGDDGLFVIPLTQKPRFFGFSATVETGAVAPDVVAGGPLVNAVDYRLAS